MRCHDYIICPGACQMLSLRLYFIYVTVHLYVPADRSYDPIKIYLQEYPHFQEDFLWKSNANI